VNQLYFVASITKCVAGVVIPYADVAIYVAGAAINIARCTTIPNRYPNEEL